MAPWSVQLCTMLRGRPNGSARRVPARGRCVAARHTAAAGRVRQGVGRDQAAPGPAARAAALATATERVRLLASSPAPRQIARACWLCAVWCATRHALLAAPRLGEAPTEPCRRARRRAQRRGTGGAGRTAGQEGQQEPAALAAEPHRQPVGQGQPARGRRRRRRARARAPAPLPPRPARKQ